MGVAVHPDGRIFVSRRDDGKVGVYDSGFNFLRFLGEGNPMVNFVKPTDLAMDAAGERVYVVDSGGDRIYAFESDESLGLILGFRGSGSGEFKYPSAIAVDAVNNRILVADQENYRVQVFDTDGIRQFQFGYRVKYMPGGVTEGWFARTAGLAVDGAGNIYVTDAVMGTLRIFDSTGLELEKVLEYGYAPGDLRTPCAVVLDGSGRILVANSNAGGVEIYSSPPKKLLSGAVGRFFAGTNLGGEELKPHLTGECLRSVGGRAIRPLHGDGGRDVAGFDPPHMLDDVSCYRCHNIYGQPGGHLGLIEGQTNVCISCHTTGGCAVGTTFRTVDMADPYGTNPSAADGLGTSHAWGVPAVNADADSVGPRAGGQMGIYLDNGNIKCTTCHDPHNNEAGAPFLRESNVRDAMCKECHAPRNLGPGEGGSHPVGFVYPSDTGEFPDASTSGLPPIKDGQVECTTCHGPHYADSGGANDGAGDGKLLRGANDEAFCQTCHTEHAAHTPGGPWQPTCNDCHSIHDPQNENLALVAQQVNGTPMTFQDNNIGSNGVSDFIHSNHAPANYDGICEVCHTATNYHRNSSEGNHEHYAGTACTMCHQHDAGFLANCDSCHGQPPDGAGFPNTAGAHATHMVGNNGPHIADCSVCHAPVGDTHLNYLVSFASGTDANGNGNIELDETDVCNVCHSAGGPFDGVAEGLANWASGTAVSCEGCHDTGSSTIQGVSAPAVAGDNATWGYFVNGHGKSGFDRECAECHDATSAHFDGIAQSFSAEFPLSGYGNPDEVEAYNNGYRLKQVNGGWALQVPRGGGYNADDFALCYSCHSELDVAGTPGTYTYQFGWEPPDYLKLPDVTVAQTNFRNEQSWGLGWNWGGTPHRSIHTGPIWPAISTVIPTTAASANQVSLASPVTIRTGPVTAAMNSRSR